MRHLLATIAGLAVITIAVVATKVPRHEDTEVLAMMRGKKDLPYGCQPVREPRPGRR
jgi:hypothetical protein